MAVFLFSCDPVLAGSALVVALSHGEAGATQRWCDTYLRTSSDCAKECLVWGVMADAVRHSRLPVVQFLCEAPLCRPFLLAAVDAGTRVVHADILMDRPIAKQMAAIRLLWAVSTVTATSVPRVAEIFVRAVATNNTPTLVEWVCETEARLRRLVPPAAIVRAREAAVHHGRVRLLRLLFVPHVCRAAVLPGETHKQRRERLGRWLTHAIRNHRVPVVVALGELVAEWSWGVIQTAVTDAVVCRSPEVIRILCGPPFHAAVFDMVPNPLIDAARRSDARVLAPMLDEIRRQRQGACWTTLSHVVASVVKAALDNGCVGVLRLCFDDAIMCDLAPVHIVQRVIATAINTRHDLTLGAHVVHTALVCLREMPGGDAAMPRNEVGLAALAKKLRDNDLLQGWRVWEHLQRELVSLSRWHRRSALLCLRRLRETGRAAWGLMYI